MCACSPDDARHAEKIAHCPHAGDFRHALFCSCWIGSQCLVPNEPLTAMTSPGGSGGSVHTACGKSDVRRPVKRACVELVRCLQSMGGRNDTSVRMYATSLAKAQKVSKPKQNSVALSNQWPALRRRNALNTTMSCWWDEQRHTVYLTKLCCD